MADDMMVPPRFEDVQLATVEVALRRLIQGKYAHFTLSFNDHSLNYQSAEDWFTSPHTKDEEGFQDWVSTPEREKALRDNTVWELICYPHTPVGFFRMRASSLQALYNWIIGEIDRG